MGKFHVQIQISISYWKPEFLLRSVALYLAIFVPSLVYWPPHMSEFATPKARTKLIKPYAQFHARHHRAMMITEGDTSGFYLGAFQQPLLAPP